MSLSHEFWVCLRTAQELADHAATVGLEYDADATRRLATTLFIESNERRKRGQDFTVGVPALYVVSPGDIGMCIDAARAWSKEVSRGMKYSEQDFERLAARLETALGRRTDTTEDGEHEDRRSQAAG